MGPTVPDELLDTARRFIASGSLIKLDADGLPCDPSQALEVQITTHRRAARNHRRMHSGRTVPYCAGPGDCLGGGWHGGRCLKPVVPWLSLAFIDVIGGALLAVVFVILGSVALTTRSDRSVHARSAPGAT